MDRYDLYSVVLVASALMWHAYLCFPGGSAGPSYFLFVLGVLPYLVLAAMAGWVRRMPLLLAAAVVLGGSDVAAVVAASSPGSSTNPVAIAVQPVFGLLVVVPLTALVACVDKLIVRRRRTAESSESDEDSADPSR